MYITLEEYKTINGIDTLTPVQEAQINFLIDSTKIKLDKLIWDVSVQNRTEKIQYRDVFYTNGVIKIYTTKVNISSVVSVDGVAYTDDYQIDWKMNHIVYIKPPYKATEYNYIELEVVNWYDPIPDDIKMLQAFMIKDAFDTINWVATVTQKKIWDKSLSFSDNSQQNRQNFIKNTILSYSISNV